jgi:hypothetical protein
VFWTYYIDYQPFQSFDGIVLIGNGLLNSGFKLIALNMELFSNFTNIKSFNKKLNQSLGRVAVHGRA